MGFGEAISAFYRGYFDFETRATRSEFWWAKLYKTLVYFVLFIVFGMMAASTSIKYGSEIATNGMTAMASIGGMVIILFFFGNLIPNIAVSVRRFHDQDKSGWMVLLRIIPYAGWLIMTIFMCLDGTNGENQFGPDPLGDSLFDTFS